MRVLFISILVLGFISCNNSEDEDNMPDFSKDSLLVDSLTLGTDYVNDIYYNLKQGEVAEVPRNNWDIGFKTNVRSSSVIINSTSGINLWEYPIQDTTKWSTLDTTGMKNSWTSLVNSDTTWSFSAFEKNMKGHPDYGWGEYNSLTHDVNGNSIFVIQLQDGSYKKIIITKREASTNTYHFKYANLNGSSSVTRSVNCGNYAKKNFVYYSLSSDKVVDREPESDKWDLLLTRYTAMISMGGPSLVPYPVVGFLQNEGVTVAKMSGDTASNDYSNASFKTAANTIGYNWKKQVSQTSSDYTIVPNQYFFVQTKDKSKVKVLFKKFESTPKSKVVFERKILK
jgi:hypothetical protein